MLRRPVLLGAAAAVLGSGFVAAANGNAVAPPGTEPDDSQPALPAPEPDVDDVEEAPAPAPTVMVAPQPGVGQGSTDFERQLAELSFAVFLSVDLGIDAGDFACSEPPSLTDGTPITCF